MRSGCEPVFKDCTFTNCTSKGGTCGRSGCNGPRYYPDVNYVVDNEGGAVYCESGSEVIFEGCVFQGNTADITAPFGSDDEYSSYGGALFFEENTVFSVSDCNFASNVSTVGGAVCTNDSDSQFADSVFSNNTAYIGGGLYFHNSTVDMIRCNVINNSADYDNPDPEHDEGDDPLSRYGSGGGLYFWGTDAILYDMQVTGNTSELSGGGLVFGGSSISNIFNMLVANNVSGRDGGGISNIVSSQLTIRNATIADNSASGTDFINHYGGGLYCSYYSHVDLSNSILWGNVADENYGPQLAIGSSLEYDPLPSSVSVNYCDIESGESGVYEDNGPTSDTSDDSVCDWGVGNKTGSATDNPLFVSGTDGDYYLMSSAADPNQTQNSLCIDAGGSNAIDLNFYRHTTRVDRGFDEGVVDLGWHYVLESDLEADFDYDYDVDLTDLTLFMNNWLDEECAFPYWCQDRDLNYDGRVDYIDNATLMAMYGDDETKPLPNPMRWEIRPYSVGDTSVSMTAVEACDNSGCPITYKFYCYNNSDPNNPVLVTNYESTSRECTFVNLANMTEYYFTVEASDKRTVTVNGTDSLINNVTTPSIAGYVIVGADAAAPLPYQAEWAEGGEPVAISETEISMEAAIASDESGVEYYFACTSNNGGHDRDWAESPEYTDTGLTPNTTYTYQVRTRDQSINHNKGAYSVEASATTPEEGSPTVDLEPPTKPSVASSYYESDEVSGTYHVIYPTLDSTDDSGTVYYKFVCVSEGGFSSGWYETSVVPSPYKVMLTPFSAPGVNYVYQWQIWAADDKGVAGDATHISMSDTFTITTSN